jgi:hypothetical protein
MRPFFWDVIEIPNVAGTVFEDLLHVGGDKRGAVKNFDTKQFELLFSQQDTKGESQKEKAAAPVSRQIQLIEDKRRQHCTLVLHHLKAESYDKLRDKILAWDVDEVMLDMLVEVAPTPAESALVQEFVAKHNEKSMLAPVEQLFCSIGSIPRLRERLELMRFKATFASEIADLGRTIATVEEAVRALRKSDSLKNLMFLVLCLGNYMNMNRQNPKPPAYGFELSTLGKLSSKYGDTTLLDFLAQEVIERHPTLRQVETELRPVADASRVDYTFLHEAIAMLSLRLSQAEEMMTMEPSETDAFVPVMRVFVPQAREHTALLSAKYDCMREALAQLHLYFGAAEDSEPQITFTVFKTFLDNLKDAERRYRTIKEQSEQKPPLVNPAGRKGRLSVSEDPSVAVNNVLAGLDHNRRRGEVATNVNPNFRGNGSRRQSVDASSESKSTRTSPRGFARPTTPRAKFEVNVGSGRASPRNKLPVKQPSPIPTRSSPLSKLPSTLASVLPSLTVHVSDSPPTARISPRLGGAAPARPARAPPRPPGKTG